MEMNLHWNWRHGVLLLLTMATFGLMMSLAPIPQNAAYHQFVDTRSYFSIPNFMDVMSNLTFLIVGGYGLYYCRRLTVGPSISAWRVFFVGVMLVSVGSAYYHWQPQDSRLVWDRIPMTIAFMGLLTAILSDYVDTRATKWLLIPLVTIGMLSVLYWVWQDDLRFYAWVQFFPALLIPLIILLFRRHYTHEWLLGVTLVCYVVAKLFEHFDAAIFVLSQHVISGHSLKHLAAAASCAAILAMLKRRGVTSL